MKVFTPRLIINIHISSYTSHNSFISTSCKLILKHILILLLAEIKTVKGMENVEHIIRPANKIDISQVMVRYTPCQSELVDIGES